MRREPQIPIGEDQTYGMGLEVNNHWGIPIVHHGGSLFGYKSDWMILPESGIGAVLLTNSDNGGSLLGPLMRRLVEIVYDAKPEAAARSIPAQPITERWSQRTRAPRLPGRCRRSRQTRSRTM